ncbi:MAG: hypothetical protein H6963_11630 [Chromatiaceae bacterium]|nr:hypothetical protein [Chromatiaceae bacterium]
MRITLDLIGDAVIATGANGGLRKMRSPAEKFVWLVITEAALRRRLTEVRFSGSSSRAHADRLLIR